MKIAASSGTPDIAMVYVLEMGEDKLLECVEAVQPPIPFEKKWVLLVSTMYGCPVGCKMCDAGGFFHGKCSKEDILAQIDFLVDKKCDNRVVPSEQFKIQFARMGEPAFNPAVLDALEALPSRYDAPGLMPSLSTIAPKGADSFLERLLEIKNEHYRGGRFQFQFSIHTTDIELRDELLPVKKWSFDQMAAFGEKFHQPGDRKVTLNFALAEGNPVDVAVLKSHFDPDTFLVKITPLNPTHSARSNQMSSYVDPHKHKDDDPLVAQLEGAGYQVIVSVGEVEENLIGSNCGQYVLKHVREGAELPGGYTYPVNRS